MKANFPSRQLIAFVIIVILVVVLAAFGVFQLHQILSREAVSDHEGLAVLSAQVMHERFGRLADLGVSLSTRVRFQELLRKNDWRAAADLLASIPGNFPNVDRIILTDTSGTLMADTPSLPGVVGENFAFRDWYRGVSLTGKPYISEIYQRAAEPELIVFAAAVPIRDLNTPDTVLGYLAIQVPIEAFLMWSKDIGIDPDARIIIIDQHAHIATNPRLTVQDPIISLATQSWVQDGLAGRHGTVVALDPISQEQQLIAYAPIMDYGWAVAIEQSAVIAFASRDNAVAITAGIALIILDFVVALIIWVSRGFTRLQRAKDEFVANASHQLKTPLVGIRWTLESLKLPEDILDARQKMYLKHLRHYGDMLVRSVEEILDASRIDLGTLTTEIQDIQFAPYMRTFVEQMGSYAEMQRRRLALTVDPAVPVTVAADGKLLYHVLQNLVSNAIEYSLPETEVKVACTLDGDEVRIAITDRGEGIAADEQPHIFEKFYRSLRAKRVKASGTGMGLYIAKAFTRTWGGRIGFSSVPNAETTFWITIPLTPNPIEQVSYYAHPNHPTRP